MNVEFMCGLLANYSKELSESETYREKGDVQLKHAKLILGKVKNCSIPGVVGRSEQCSGCKESTGETKLWCCNHCGKRIENF